MTEAIIRVNKEVGIQKPFFDYYFINVGYDFKVSCLLSKLLSFT